VKDAATTYQISVFTATARKMNTQGTLVLPYAAGKKKAPDYFPWGHQPADAPAETIVDAFKKNSPGGADLITSIMNATLPLKSKRNVSRCSLVSVRMFSS